eukprot:CAMPEP_0179608738 /NCGR_PEP_ID=MMETSP0930-20121108/2614_1 /TAXON_ID=548131 ORGANISM="Ostreococcus mediterraneus, Strain clade-D-RCC1621" /NCGR_SAMPLE_ID=MMETSP0930 /ASSEMBLY_ACC=CAM_ASM_000580 /LENGTH=319 /DNA_ID=CAMNT_0021477253 /DNA_START=214 /DNA_END=1173 /DNA_ORIENTATION=-
MLPPKYATTAFVSIELFTSVRSDRPIPPSFKAWSKLLADSGGHMHLITDNSYPLVPGFGSKVTVLDIDANTIPTWSKLCEIMLRSSRERWITGYVNNDIFPSFNFLTTLSALQKVTASLNQTRTAKPHELFKTYSHSTKGWFAVATRWDLDLNNRNCVAHTQGGYDLWLWNNIDGDNSLLGENFTIPPFHIARPYFDMWFLSAAIQTGHRHVIDLSQATHIFHVNHQRTFRGWSEAVRVQHNDKEWNENHELAFKTYCDDAIMRAGTCMKYQMATGTVCETPLYLTKQLHLQERVYSVPYKCMKKNIHYLSDEEYDLIN